MTRVLSPTRIGPLALPNRLAVAPMTRVSATAEGHATERMARYYARFAERGFGLVITVAPLTSAILGSIGPEPASIFWSVPTTRAPRMDVPP